MGNVKCSFQIETVCELSYDHFPELLDLGDEWDDIAKPTRNNLKTADWDTFRNKVDRNLKAMPSPESTEDIDRMVDLFTDAIHLSLEESIPKTSLKPINLYDLPHGLAESVKLKNQIRQQWQRTRNETLKAKYNHISKHLKTDLLKHRRKLWDTKVASLQVEIILFIK